MKYYQVNGEIVRARNVSDAISIVKKNRDKESAKDILFSAFPAIETNTKEHLRTALSLKKHVEAGKYRDYYIRYIKENMDDDIENHIQSWLAADAPKKNIQQIHSIYKDLVSHYNDASLKAALAKWEQKASRLLHDCEDSDGVNFDFLILEKKKSVADYKEAIRQTDDPKLLSLLSRILEEETRHIEELEAARNLAAEND